MMTGRQGNQQGAWQSDRGGLAKEAGWDMRAGCGQRKMGQAGTWEN